MRAAILALGLVACGGHGGAVGQSASTEAAWCDCIEAAAVECSETGATGADLEWCVTVTKRCDSVVASLTCSTPAIVDADSFTDSCFRGDIGGTPTVANYCAGVE